MQATQTAAAVAIRAGGAGTGTGAIALPRILFVCTANRCRSPLAEHLMRRALHQAGLHALVTSAGLLEGGFSTPSTGVQVAAANGLDLTKHRSSRVSARAVEVSDVILTMNRAHAREIVALAPESWPRVYPLKQFTEFLEHVELPRRIYFRDAAMLVGETRKRSSILGNPDFDAVQDPVGSPAAVWRTVLVDLQNHLDRVIRPLAPLISGWAR